MSDLKMLNQAYLGNIRYNDELELVSVLSKDFLEVGSLRLRPDGGSDGVPFLEESIDDVDGREAVRAGDEDFASWSDDWHALLFPESLMSVREGSEVWRSVRRVW